MPAESQRTSGIRPAPQTEERPVHLGWQQLRAALRGAGVAPGLVGARFPSLLGRHARARPTRRALFEVLDAFFGGESPGLYQERYVVQRQGPGASACGVVAGLAAAVPELGPLALVEERIGGRQRFVLRTADAQATLDEQDVAADELADAEATYVRRTVSVDAIVEATNQLLAHRGLPMRFLPIDVPEDVCAYLAVDWAVAVKLAAASFWDAHLDELIDFAAWSAQAPEQSTAHPDLTTEVA